MAQDHTTALRKASPYSAVITREQFLFYEMRTTAKLMNEGLDDHQIEERIISENLFQYPTERSLSSIARACIRRLHAMQDDSLVTALAAQPAEVSKQICLYAMMKHYRLVWDFMLTVVGEKYRLRDHSFGKIDVNAFFLRLQEQDDGVATWSDKTVAKAKQVLMKILIENGYLDSFHADHINPVWLSPVLEDAIRNNHDEIILPAFNCFS